MEALERRGRCPDLLHPIAVVAVSIAGGSTNSRVSPDAAGKKTSAKAPGDRISFNVVPSAAAGCLPNGRRAGHIHARGWDGDDARVNEARTVIVGAGQAGLAVSRYLTEADHDHVLLEQARVGERWRSERWDSLTLLSRTGSTGCPERGPTTTRMRS